MAPYFPPPSKDTLLLPLLACLPIAFVSARPPPALLPILSPILRQRIKFLSEDGSSDSTWLTLLCWESSKAEELPSIVESVSFEPHSVSGEVEFGDIESIEYRKLDEETLQSRLRLPDVGLEVRCLWCEGDQEGGEDGWRMNELTPLQDASEDSSRAWHKTISEADEMFKAEPLHNDKRPEARVAPNMYSLDESITNEATDNDDAYWAQYDQSSSQTPAQRYTPNPPPPYSKREAEAEDEYFARYENVQPQMDNDDPSADREAIGQSTLNGDSLSQHLPLAADEMVQGTIAETQSKEGGDKTTENLVHTRPSSSSSVSAVAQLEQSAQHQSQAEFAIQQHISTTMKSLYRLTRGAGIENSEFRRLVQNELDTVGIMDEED